LPTAQSLPVQIERKIGTSRFQGSYLNLAQFMARGEPHLGGEREVEVKPMATPLILKRASVSRPSGQWRDDDYAVLENGVVVGRIFKVQIEWLFARRTSSANVSARLNHPPNSPVRVVGSAEPRQPLARPARTIVFH
jgi:hypothetical protein